MGLLLLFGSQWKVSVDRTILVGWSRDTLRLCRPFVFGADGF